MPSLIDSSRPLVLAHRGDSRVAPENTRPAFESALKLGVDLVELDYHHSADGVPVVFHDEELDRCTDACSLWGGQKIPIASRTWAELCRLDAGRWWGEQFAGTRLLKLEDALKLICPRAGCMIERKGGDAETLAALLRRLGCLDRCVVTAFDWNFLARCRELSPDLLLGALGSHPLTEAHLDAAQEFGAQVIGWDNDFVTAHHIRQVHSRGLKAWVWTVDEPSRAAELIGWGVDGLISNVPGEMQPIVVSEGPNVQT
ncbi:MAG TPA: glycerophosphodiester phosphodiesterase family protein [Pirellulales bacterium]|jgi:glycerophosphoryl diester phosphodiesterase|nr:glycerophosphodiester phosphodiesterase family protein [Pirellulales bacterium]